MAQNFYFTDPVAASQLTADLGRQQADRESVRRLLAEQNRSQTARQNEQDRMAYEYARLMNQDRQFGQQLDLSKAAQAQQADLFGKELQNRLEVAKLRPTDRYGIEYQIAKDAMNQEQAKANTLATGNAGKANLELDAAREERDLNLSDLPGPDWWNADYKKAKVKSDYSAKVASIAAKYPDVELDMTLPNPHRGTKEPGAFKPLLPQGYQNPSLAPTRPQLSASQGQSEVYGPPLPPRASDINPANPTPAPAPTQPGILSRAWDWLANIPDRNLPPSYRRNQPSFTDRVTQEQSRDQALRQLDQAYVNEGMAPDEYRYWYNQFSQP